MKKPYTIIVIVLAFINILMLMRVFTYKNAVRDSTILLENQFIQSQESKYLLSYYFKSITQSNVLLNKEIGDFYDGISVNDSLYLCLIISTKNCSACIKTELELLHFFKEEYGIEKTYILMEFLTDRELSFFVEEFDIQDKIIQSNEIVNENHNNPYYFLVINGRIHYPFMPIKEYPEITKAYFEKVSQVFNYY